MISAAEKADELRRLVRGILKHEAPRPTERFRREAWRAFQEALDTHLATKRRR